MARSVAAAFWRYAARGSHAASHALIHDIGRDYRRHAAFTPVP
jgi:hypothetical protein